MPCNADYMEPTEIEKNLSVVYGLLDELRTGSLPDNYGNGYDKRIYRKGLSKEHLNEKTAELCYMLRQVKDVTKYSLELQFWWRDHQIADSKQQNRHEAPQQKETEACLFCGGDGWVTDHYFTTPCPACSGKQRR